MLRRTNHFEVELLEASFSHCRLQHPQGPHPSPTDASHHTYRWFPATPTWRPSQPQDCVAFPQPLSQWDVPPGPSHSPAMQSPPAMAPLPPRPVKPAAPPKGNTWPRMQLAAVRYYSFFFSFLSCKIYVERIL